MVSTLFNNLISIYFVNIHIYFLMLWWLIADDGHLSVCTNSLCVYCVSWGLIGVYLRVWLWMHLDRQPNSEFFFFSTNWSFDQSQIFFRVDLIGQKTNLWKKIRMGCLSKCSQCVMQEKRLHNLRCNAKVNHLHVGEYIYTHDFINSKLYS